MQLLTRGNWFQKEAGLHFIHPHKIISFRIVFFFFFLLLRDIGGGGGGNPRALLYRATTNPIRSRYQMNPIPLELRGFATFMLIFPTLANNSPSDESKSAALLTYTFKMRSRISIRGWVRPSVRPSVRHKRVEIEQNRRF